MKKKNKKDENMNYVLRKLNENCISMNQFSKMTGLDRSGLFKLANGKHKPRLDTIKILALGLEKIDEISWKEHAANIQQEINGNPVLRIVGEE